MGSGSTPGKRGHMRTRIKAISLLALGALSIGSLAAIELADPIQNGSRLQSIWRAIAELGQRTEKIAWLPGASGTPGAPGAARTPGPPGTGGLPGPASTEADNLFANRLALGRDAFTYGSTTSPKLIVHDESRELATIAFFKYSEGFANHMVQGRARGSITSPADVNGNDVVAQYSGHGYLAGGFQKVGAVNMQVDANGDLASGMTGKLVFKVAGLNGSTHSFDTAVEMDRRLRTVFQGAVALRYTSHPLIQSNQDDYELGEQRTSVHRFVTDAPRDITGFVATKDIDSSVVGEVMTLINVGEFELILANQSPGSRAPDRIITGTGASLRLGHYRTATLFYDQTSARWRVLSTTGA